MWGRTPLQSAAWMLILLFGMVSLFADMTYEGARSIIGPYLLTLGASAPLVGFVSGFGELLGYGLRLASGYLSDRTKKYWMITIIGYVINLIAVPLLGLVGNWPVALFLIISERIGKAIRAPAKDTLLSYATKNVGRGWGFGVHEALDQVGAIAGPLIVAAILYMGGNYSISFILLAIPALISLAFLATAYFSFPQPEQLESRAATPPHFVGFNLTYWTYIMAISLIGLGFIGFPLIAYYFQDAKIMSPVWIPLFYAIAMAADGLAALLFGYLFDKKGVIVLVIITALTALFAPLIFMGTFLFAIIGIILWGIALGVQESIMRALVANLIDMDHRGSAYGILSMAFGVCWLLGNILAGFLYEISILALVLFSVLAQWAAIPFLLAVNKQMK